MRRARRGRSFALPRQPSVAVLSILFPGFSSISLTSASASVTAVTGTASTRVSDLRRRAIGVAEEDDEEEEGRGDNSAAIGDDGEAALLVRPGSALVAAAVARRLSGAAAAEALEEDAMPASIATIVLRVESERESEVGQVMCFFFLFERGKGVKKKREAKRDEKRLSLFRRQGGAGWIRQLSPGPAAAPPTSARRISPLRISPRRREGRRRTAAGGGPTNNPGQTEGQEREQMQTLRALLLEQPRTTTTSCASCPCPRTRCFCRR